MAETYESSNELAAERGSLERLRRIHWVAQELIENGYSSGISEPIKTASARQGNVCITVTKFKIPKESPQFSIALQLNVERHIQQKRRIGARSEPDSPIQLVIEFGAQPDQFRILLDGCSVWAGGKQILPSAHGTVLETLHLAADILEREQIRTIQAAIRADLERRGIRLASLEVVKEELAESERPVPAVAVDETGS